MNWFYEDLSSLQFKVARMETDSAFAEDPPSRVRRLISNVRVHETSTPGEYLAQSYILLRRNRGDAYASDSISARRDDLIRRTDSGWKLAQRTILMDQAVLGTPNLAVFL
jgi:3-phenylpropionate/cinnamic acid dioxygenase small subunit